VLSNRILLGPGELLATVGQNSFSCFAERLIPPGLRFFAAAGLVFPGLDFILRAPDFPCRFSHP
jgi:hypothetical protein